MKKFIILGSHNYANKRIKKELTLLGYSSLIVDPANVIFDASEKEPKEIFFASESDPTPQSLKISDILGVIPRIGRDLAFFSRVVEFFQTCRLPTTATATALTNAQDKVLCTLLLGRTGVQVPKTIAMPTPQNIAFIADKLGGFPLVAKTVTGSQGVGVFILRDVENAQTTLEAFNEKFLLCEFVQTASDAEPKHDYRAVVIGGEVVASIKRKSVGDDFRTNASLHEDCEGVELSDKMKNIALQAANAVGLACAGVDLAVNSTTGETVCYEVNGNFNFFSTEKYSKKNVAKKIAEYAVFLAKLPKNEPLPIVESEFAATRDENSDFDGVFFSAKRQTVFVELLKAMSMK